MYAADELLVQQGVQVNVFEKLPTPYGLVRSGQVERSVVRADLGEALGVSGITAEVGAMVRPNNAHEAHSVVLRLRNRPEKCRAGTQTTVSSST